MLVISSNIGDQSMNIFALDYIALIVFLIYAVRKLLRTMTSKDEDKDPMQVPHE
jgi:flagellar biogenesis protein FliO